MNIIGELLARDLNQKIEEIIKVNQTDEKTVYTELNEYIATDRIKDEYLKLLKSLAEAPRHPDEGVGVWISGFFGSGKSSFAKNLGYLLANRTVLGHSAADLFKERVNDRRVGEYVDFIKVSVPTEVIMFDVSVDRAVKRSTERIAEIMYTVLLRELDYAEDYDIAELEIELEEEGKLDRFIQLCQETYGLDWRTVRKGAQKISRASTILHLIDSRTYPTPESWSISLQNKNTDITVGKFVDRTFELCRRRRPGKGLVYIIDEVGQYVARSADKIEDLRAVVEQFGRVGKNLVQAGKAPAPVWIIVTSQEKLDEVVAALDSKRVELAKLQDRFHLRVDLAPADIREVATKRVLAKKPGAEQLLKNLFNNNQGQLNVACRLERTTRNSKITEADFIQFYPYLPHFVEMSIDIMSGIRLQPGADKHLGGSNRTIIKQAYEMLISERTALAMKPVGTLVSLDKIFELVEGNLSSERQKDISDITQRFKSDPEDKGMAARVAKAICLLEFIKDLPRTEANVAAVLVEHISQSAPLVEVQQALTKLQNAQFVRNTEEGWKLQTNQEKNWDTERRSYLNPKLKEQNDILRDTMRELFSEANLKTYRYRTLKTFSVGISVDGVKVGDEGKIPLSIITSENNESFPAKLSDIRNESRHKQHENDLYWVFAQTFEVDGLIKELFASRQMVTKYDQLRAQSKITNEEAACLQTEKKNAGDYQRRLGEKLTEALEKGQGLFKGVSYDAASLGKVLPEILKKLFDQAVPQLYPKLEMGARQLKGSESEEILKAANLNGLSKLFYGGDQGLNLVTNNGGKYVPNPESDIAKEVLDYLNREHGYGNKDTRTGKALENHFGGLGYGWDLDILKLVLAVLFRAGSIEITYGGKRYDSYQDPQSRSSFTANPAFRGTLFTPSLQIDLGTLKKAVETYEELTGQTVDVEKNAIASAIKRVAEKETQYMFSLEAKAYSNKLPVAGLLKDYKDTIGAFLSGTADDCVRALAGEGTTFKEIRDRVHKLGDVTDDQGLSLLQRARVASAQMWPTLNASGSYQELAEIAEELKQGLASEDFYGYMYEIKDRAEAINKAYRVFYTDWHERRARLFIAAIVEVKEQPEWENLSEDLRPGVLNALTSRACKELDLPEGVTSCQHCRATTNQMESDIAGLSGLRSDIYTKIQQIITPKKKVTRVRVADFFNGALNSEDSIRAAVELLQEQLLKLLAEDVTIVIE